MNSELVELSVFNLESRKAYLEDGTEGEITEFFDSDGLACSPEEAVVFIAEFKDIYIVVDTRAYDKAKMH